MKTRQRQSIAKPKFYLAPDGKIVHCRLLDEICNRSNMLNIRQMRKLARGIILNYKGWTLIAAGKRKM